MLSATCVTLGAIVGACLVGGPAATAFAIFTAFISASAVVIFRI